LSCWGSCAPEAAARPNIAASKPWRCAAASNSSPTACRRRGIDHDPLDVLVQRNDPVHLRLDVLVEHVAHRRQEAAAEQVAGERLGGHVAPERAAGRRRVLEQRRQHGLEGVDDRNVGGPGLAVAEDEGRALERRRP
jgi:hypothetical protein